MNERRSKTEFPLIIVALAVFVWIVGVLVTVGYPLYRVLVAPDCFTAADLTHDPRCSSGVGK